MGENPFSRRAKPAVALFGEGNPYANAEIEGLSSEIVYRLRARRSTGKPKGGHLRLQRDRLSWGAPPPLPTLILCGSFVLVGLCRYLRPRPASVQEIPFSALRAVRRGSGHGVLVVESDEGITTYSNVSARACVGLIERLARALREVDILFELNDDGAGLTMPRPGVDAVDTTDTTRAPAARFAPQSVGYAAETAPGSTGRSLRYRRQYVALGALAVLHLGLIGVNLASVNDVSHAKNRPAARTESGGLGLVLVGGGLVLADDPGTSGLLVTDAPPPVAEQVISIGSAGGSLGR